MAVCMYREHEKQDRDVAHAAYSTEPHFSVLEEKSSARGYRHATLAEINASAERDQGAPDLYCWAGGIWVRIA